MRKGKKKKSKDSEKGLDECFRESLKILSIRAYSVREVGRKLIERGFSESDKERTIETLVDYGYLDDLDLIRALIDTKFRVSGYGRKRVKEYLYRRKLPPGLVREEVEKLMTREGAVERGVDLLSRKKRFSGPTGREDREKILRFLALRGFELSECKDIISEYEKSVEIENDRK